MLVVKLDNHKKNKQLLNFLFNMTSQDTQYKFKAFDGYGLDVLLMRSHLGHVLTINGACFSFMYTSRGNLSVTSNN